MVKDSLVPRMWNFLTSWVTLSCERRTALRVIIGQGRSRTVWTTSWATCVRFPVWSSFFSIYGLSALFYQWVSEAPRGKSWRRVKAVSHLLSVYYINMCIFAPIPSKRLHRVARERKNALACYVSHFPTTNVAQEDLRHGGNGGWICILMQRSESAYIRTPTL
jgi:hypothetical protein